MLLTLAPVMAQAAQSGSISAVFSTTGLHAGDHAVAAVILEVKPGLHAQSHTPSDPSYIPLVLTLDPNSKLTFGNPIYPPGQDETYPALGTINVYTGQVIVRVPVTAKTDVSPGPVTIAGNIRLQACNATSCFAPERLPFNLITAIVPQATPVEPNRPDLFKSAAAVATGVNTTGVSWAIVPMFALAFVVGIIFNAMPCVLPVVPLKIMGFYEVSQHDRRKSVALGAVFSLGLIASFGVLALLVVGLRVLDWGGLFQKPWFTIAIVIVLLVMAISLFGFFTVNLPSSIYQFSPRHDTYVGNFLFGILTAALSTPCTFGMFVGLLTWSLAQTAVVGVGAIMMVGVGMAFPYFVLSAFPEIARRFPRTGPWAEVVKQMMAFLLLATAVYFAQPLYEKYVSDAAFWWTMFGVIAAAAVFLVIRSIQLSHTLRPRLIAGVIALAMIVPSLWAVLRLTYQPYDWQKYSEQTLASARASGKPVLVDFTATWCGNCHFIEGFVLHNPKVVAALHQHGVVMMKADVTNTDSPAHPLLSTLSPAEAIPLTAIYPPNSSEPKLLDGIYTADDLLRLLSQATQQ